MAAAHAVGDKAERAAAISPELTGNSGSRGIFACCHFTVSPFGSLTCLPPLLESRQLQ
jgi:hypothetical protein